MNQFDREIERLENELACGEITQREYIKQMNKLERDYRAEAEEAAQQAYDDEINRW